MKKALAIALFCIGVSDGFCQHQLLLEDPTIPATDTVWVFLPDTYKETSKYAVVYMLHGYSGNYKQWHGIMDAQDYANEYQMIIVLPDGFYNSWYINSPAVENSQYADFFFEKLMPEVEKAYRIDTTNRFVTGLSMGGHGALHLFLQKPDRFRSAGSTSGVIDLRNSSQAYELAEFLGDYETNQKQWLHFSAIGNLTKLKDAEKEIIFDCGTEDVFYESNKLFYEQCLERDIPVTFISRPGEHNADYWKESVRSHFEFFVEKQQ